MRDNQHLRPAQSLAHARRGAGVGVSLVATTWVACKQILNLKTRASFQQISNVMRDQDYRFMFVAFIVLHDRGKLTLCVNQQHTATASSSEPPARPEHGTRCDSVGGKPGTSSTVKLYSMSWVASGSHRVHSSAAAAVATARRCCGHASAARPTAPRESS